MSVASEITRIKNNIANAYTAINSKGGTLPQTQNSANLATAINSISGGGSGSIQVINGIIEQYKASNQTISANSFVQFIGDTQLVKNTSGASVYENIVAVKVSSDKVFVVHRSGNNLNAIICTINGTTIIPGTDIVIVNGGSGIFAYSNASAQLIDTNKVFVAHRYGSDMMGVVCDISGTTITVGTDTLLVSGNSAGHVISTTLVETNKVFIAHRKGNALNGVVCTISGITITTGTDTELVSGTSVYTGAIAQLIDTNKVLITHRGTTTALLNGVVCTINDTTITAGADTELVSGSNAYGNASIVAISTNKAFISHRNGSYLYGIICTINNTTITVGTDTQLTNESNSYTNAFAILAGTNKVFIAHRSINDNLYGLLCTIDNATITVDTDTKIAEGISVYVNSSVVLVDTNKVFIAHRNDDDLYGIVFKINGTNIEDMITIVPSSTKIEGLLATQATENSAGNVWVLNS